MARYIETAAMAGQGKFMTVNFANQLLPGTFEYTLNKLVERQLALGSFDMAYRNDNTGRPAISPGTLLKLVLYGYSRGQYSSRRLEKLSKTNIVAKALTGDIEADHATIACFVSKNGDKLKDIFLQVLMVCDGLGLIGRKMFAIDGVRLPSHAAKEWSGTHEKLRKKKEKFEALAARLIEEHQKNDKNKHQGDWEREEKAIKKLNKKAAYIQKFLDENKGMERIGVSGQEIQSNVTDNESAKIKGPHGVIQGYIGITAADSENQIIVAAEACGTDYEGGEFANITDKLNENLQAVTGVEEPLAGAPVLLDTNYFSEDNLQKAQEKGLDVLIPDPHFRQRDGRFAERLEEKKGKAANKGAAAEPKFTIDDFRYNEEDNSYTCPMGKKLESKGKTGLRHGRSARRYTAKHGDCKDCPCMKRCMSSRGGKTPHKTLYLMEGKEEWQSEKMRRRIDSPEGKRLYSYRMGIIEPCFANIEYCKGLNRFTLRGKKKVNGQWLLFCLVHNIGKCTGAYMEKRRKRA